MTKRKMTRIILSIVLYYYIFFMFSQQPKPQTVSELTNNLIVAILFNLEYKNSKAVLDELLNDNFLSNFLISFTSPAKLQDTINEIYPSLISARGFQGKLLACRDEMFIALNNEDFIKAHTRLEQVYEPDNEFYEELTGDETYDKYVDLVNALNFSMPEYKPELLPLPF